MCNEMDPETVRPDEEKKNLANPAAGIQALGTPEVPWMQSPIHCISIVGQVEGHMILPPHNKTTKYEHVLPMLIAIEENPEIKGFIVLLNTVGGDVEAGLAIAEMIRGMSKPSVSIVLGGGHSIGVPLAVSARRSYIVPSATMTVHPIRLTGLVVGVPQTYEYLNRMQERVVNFICAHSHISKEKLMELMLQTGELATDVGTILVGEEGVSCGLIDQVGSLSDALSYLKGQIQEADGK